MEIQASNPNKQYTAIDKALAAARARKEAKSGEDATKVKISSTKTPNEKTVARAAKDAERATKKLERESQRAARRAAKATVQSDAKKPHMKKIERAASCLPKMTEAAERFFNEATTNFSAEQITAIALQLQHFNRVKATERALNQKLEVGQCVRIISGPTKYVGMCGTIDHAQRIRCFVAVPGIKKPVYLFTSDVEVFAMNQATGTDG